MGRGKAMVCKVRVCVCVGRAKTKIVLQQNSPPTSTTTTPPAYPTERVGEGRWGNTGMYAISHQNNKFTTVCTSVVVPVSTRPPKPAGVSVSSVKVSVRKQESTFFGGLGSCHFRVVSLQNTNNTGQVTHQNRIPHTASLWNRLSSTIQELLGIFHRI